MLAATIAIGELTILAAGHFYVWVDDPTRDSPRWSSFR
jgi:hypothetical protein